MPDGQKDGTISRELLANILRKEFPGYPITAIRLGESGWLLNPFTGRIYPADSEDGPNWEVQMLSSQGSDGELITQPVIVLCPDVLVNENDDRVTGAIVVQIREDEKIRVCENICPTGSYLSLAQLTPCEIENHHPDFVGYVHSDLPFVDGVRAVYLVMAEFPDDEAIGLENLSASTIGSVDLLAAIYAHCIAFPDEEERDESGDDVFCVVDLRGEDDELP